MSRSRARVSLKTNERTRERERRGASFVLSLVRRPAGGLPFFSQGEGEKSQKKFRLTSSSAPHLPRAGGLDGPPALAAGGSLGSSSRGGRGGGDPLAPAGRAGGAVGQEGVLEGGREARRDDRDVQLALVCVVDDLLSPFFRRSVFLRERRGMRRGGECGGEKERRREVSFAPERDDP